MNRSTYLRSFLLTLVVSALVLSACGTAPTPTQPPAPTAVPPTETATVVPSATSTPTRTPRPTATPNLAATKAYEDAMSRITAYVESGYLSSAEGKLYKLDDWNRDMAQMNFIDYGFSGFDKPVQNFAVWGDIRMESAMSVSGPEYSGCGFSFRINESNYDGYTAQITNQAVLMTFCNASINRCGRLGKTRGTGTLKLPNPAEASMELVVNGTQAYVMVNGEFIGEYTLFTDKMLEPGYLLYSIISGTNKDYGTRCEISNAHLWAAK